MAYVPGLHAITRELPISWFNWPTLYHVHGWRFEGYGRGPSRKWRRENGGDYIPNVS